MGIRVGTVTCRTAANKYFGPEEGREVKLHIISFGTLVSTLEFQEFQNYSTYIQEIITCISDSRNSDIVKNVLLPIFVGKARDIAAAIPAMEESTAQTEEPDKTTTAAA